MKTVVAILLASMLATAGDCVDCTADLQGTEILTATLPEIFADLPIATPSLPQNTSIGYCNRNPDVVDTVVLHHTGTSATTSIRSINHDHSRVRNPRYRMIGYHYLVYTAYAGSSGPQTQVTQGRPFSMVGSHAGHEAYPREDISAQTRTIMRETGAFRCYDARGRATRPEASLRIGQVRPSGNTNTVGVAVVGNYEEQGLENPFSEGRRRPSVATIELLGRLLCQIQRERPRVTRLRVHQDYKRDTDCPGSLEEYLGQIREQAARYGCRFD